MGIRQGIVDMTLYELLQLIKRYWKLCVILPVVCAFVCGAFLLIRDSGGSYTANAYIVAGSTAQVSSLNGTASSAAREFQQANSGYKASVKADNASLTVTVTVTGPDSQGTADAANEIAESSVTESKKLLGAGNISANVKKASVGKAQSGKSIPTYVLVALLAGLFVAVCIVVGIDAVRRPVKGSRDLATVADLPVLAEIPVDSGDRLLANVRFASGEKVPHGIMVIPASTGESASQAATLLSAASGNESPDESQAHGGPVTVVASEPLLQDVAPVYEAQKADAVLIVASQWTDSLKDVEATVAQLKLAGANVVGCVLVREESEAKVSGKAKQTKSAGKRESTR